MSGSLRRAGRKQRKYVYGKTREVVHTKWIELARQAAHGPVVAKVPTVSQYLWRWLSDTVGPNLAPLTYATYESHVRHYLDPGSGRSGSIGSGLPMSSAGSTGCLRSANAVLRARTPGGSSVATRAAAQLESVARQRRRPGRSRTFVRFSGLPSRARCARSSWRVTWPSWSPRQSSASAGRALAERGGAALPGIGPSGPGRHVRGVRVDLGLGSAEG